MSQTLNSAVAVVGIDIGKNSFHTVGLDGRGAIVLRQKWSRGQVEARPANMPSCLIGMEACVGAHHLSRKLKALGHDARLMPAKYVRPYSKGQKNDFRDAEAIAEAVQRPTMKFVATKTADQLDLQAHIVFASDWSASTPASSIKSVPSCWSVASRFGRASASCVLSCRASSPRHPMSCRPAWCGHRGSGGRLAPARREHRESIGRDRNCCTPGCWLRAADERAWHWADHLQRDGGHDQHWRGVLQRPRLRCLAGARSQADPTGDRTILGKNIETRQSLPEGSVRPRRRGSVAVEYGLELRAWVAPAVPEQPAMGPPLMDLRLLLG